MATREALAQAMRDMHEAQEERLRHEETCKWCQMSSRLPLLTRRRYCKELP